MPDATTPPTLRVRDVAERFGLNERFVRHLVFEKRIPHYKVGTMLLFDADELDKWWADKRVNVECT